MTVTTSEALRTEASRRLLPPPSGRPAPGVPSAPDAALGGAEDPGADAGTPHAAADAGTSHAAADAEAAVRADLTRLLFADPDPDRTHGTWRELVAGPAFTYRPGLSPAERAALSYDRLRLLNDALTAEAPAAPVAFAADPHRLAALHEWIGPVDGGLTTLASIHYNLFLGSLVDHDHQVDHQGDHDGGATGTRDLSPFAAMRRVGTFLCTELEHGNDVAAMETVAVLDRASGGFDLHTPTPGAAKFMPNTSLTGGPKTAVVAARLLIDGEDQGIFLFLTPLSDARGHLPGVTVRRLPERTGTPVDHCLTSFDHVRLPREALLQGEHGRLAPDSTLTSTLGNRRKRFLRSIGRVTMGKLCMSAGTLGMARAAVTLAVRHAHSRRIAGPRTGERIPVAAHRSHHGRLLDALATAYAMTFLHRAVVDRFAARSDEDREEVERLAAVAKGWITWQARDIAIECRERCGAQGLFPANGISDLPASIEGGITAEGDNLVIWVKAASEMVFGHRVPLPPARTTPGDTGGPGDPSGLAAPPGGLAGPGGPGDLDDPAFLRDLLLHAESIWQNRARTALREGPSGDPMGRWNATSAPALEMVEVHACRVAADAFLTAADRATDPTARAVLRALCRLFLLRRLRAHTGDLLAEGLLTPDQVRSLPRALDAATAQSAPHLATLADAFALPPGLLSTIPLANGESITRAPDPAAADPARATVDRF
ncbi:MULTISPECIES: acyl-CoA dehydrogenase [unclassified Streptomyces]|uniref:acyl-CoA dehydrogenase family protein n=1 Tax=unclassified Streptomyces TaxID=2593676 RepID=UPI000996F659|nr:MULTISPECIES: acyl-CoA dehydrogenase [unclassified Streptomyces]